MPAVLTHVRPPRAVRHSYTNQPCKTIQARRAPGGTPIGVELDIHVCTLAPPKCPRHDRVSPRPRGGDRPIAPHAGSRRWLASEFFALHHSDPDGGRVFSLDRSTTLRIRPTAPAFRSELRSSPGCRGCSRRSSKGEGCPRLPHSWGSRTAARMWRRSPLSRPSGSLVTSALSLPRTTPNPSTNPAVPPTQTKTVAKTVDQG